MRWTKSFLKTLKTSPTDEVSKNARLLAQAGFVDKLMAGVYTFLPLGFRVLKKIETIIREEMNRAGGQELLMPSLHPKHVWEKTGRWETMDDLFRFVSYYTKTELALGPTHEEVLVPLSKKIVLSYKDLPQYIFQIQTKFRDEKRSKSGILRTREFVMKDLYSFHADEKDLEAYYELMKKVYARIFTRAGIGKETYITFASGGTFSKYSHEFQTATEAGEDIIFVCEKCKVAVNKEIIEEQKACPECSNKNLVEKKSIEVGNIFKLNTKFSKPFGLTYTDEKGIIKDVVMGCYGIGLGRLMGTAVEVLSDEKGIVWPKSIAPYMFHLIAIEGKGSGKVRKQADALYKKLLDNNIEVLYDDRPDKPVGEKFHDADLIGIPYRVVISENTLKKGSVELKQRDKEKSRMVKIKELLSFAKKN